MKSSLLLCAFVFLLGFSPSKVFSASCVQQGPDTIRTNTVITGSCIINGDLIILDGGALHVDLTGGQADTFIVRGNILLEGNATLYINADSGSTGAQFVVSNSNNNQRTITTRDSSRVILQYIEFRTQEGDLSSTGSYYMNYYAHDSSALSVTGCWLNTQKAWLLLNLNNRSTFIGDEVNEVPTEVYLQDTAQMSIHGTNTKIGLWLLFQTTTDTLNLPDQSGSFFNWQVGRGNGGVAASQWFLNVDNAKPGLGVQVQPFAKLVMNGRGLPNTGEAHVNLLFANGTDTIENLGAGLQNLVVAKGRLTLNNVNMGPIGWQLYSVSNETLFIDNSLVNELGVVGPNNTVVVDSSILQLATLSALGSNASNVTVNKSAIWSQSIIAANACSLTLNSCNVTGSWFSTDGLSHINVNGGCFFPNPSGCTQNTMVNISTGLPNCNPFIPAGLPNIVASSTVTLNGVNSNCTSSIENISGNQAITIYPNPFSIEARIETSEGINYSALTVYNSIGKSVKQLLNISGPAIILTRANLSPGVYFIRLTQENGIVSSAKFIIVD